MFDIVKSNKIIIVLGVVVLGIIGLVLLLPKKSAVLPADAIQLQAQELSSRAIGHFTYDSRTKTVQYFDLDQPGFITIDLNGNQQSHLDYDRLAKVGTLAVAWSPKRSKVAIIGQTLDQKKDHSIFDFGLKKGFTLPSTLERLVWVSENQVIAQQKKELISVDIVDGRTSTQTITELPTNFELLGADNRYIIVLVTSQGQLHRFDRNNKKLSKLDIPKIKGQIVQVFVDRVGQRYLLQTKDPNRVYLYQQETRRLNQLTSAEAIQKVFWAPDGSWLVVAQGKTKDDITSTTLINTNKPIEFLLKLSSTNQNIVADDFVFDPATSIIYYRSFGFLYKSRIVFESIQQ